MKHLAFKFLKTYSTAPRDVDRLIVSSFLYINGIQVRNNNLLNDYIIRESETEEFTHLNNFISVVLKGFPQFNHEDLIELFEFVISPSDRIVNGAIYTPTYIREYILTQALLYNNNLDIVKIADIACGCGGFLFTAAKQLRQATGNCYEYIFSHQIYGVDIQEYSVTRSKLLLSLLALAENEDIENFVFNIYRGDALIFKWENYFEGFSGFQIIVGNPPYVSARNLEDEVKKNLPNWSVSKSGNPDLYIPFFQIGYENLAENGILGFITMNTFFKSLNGRALRKYFEDNSVGIRIIDFGTEQIFRSKSTYTCICFLENTEQNYIEYYRSIDKILPTVREQYCKIGYGSLHAKKGWNLNDNEIISRIESIGRPLGELYNTRHGIATLRNDLYIFKPIDEDNDFFYLQNGNLFPIEKNICRDIINSNRLSRNIDLDDAIEKVLFPYTDERKPKILEEDYLKTNYPYAYEYLSKKKLELAKRDKGNGNYDEWFAFGRTQSLEKVGNKLFFPKYSDVTPSYLLSTDEDLLFYNGQAIVGHSEEEMHFIRKIMESRLFWYYIKTSSKPYSSNYFSLNGTYIKNFGIPEFSMNEIAFLLEESDKNIIDEFLEDYYKIHL